MEHIGIYKTTWRQINKTNYLLYNTRWICTKVMERNIVVKKKYRRNTVKSGRANASYKTDIRLQ